MHMRFQSAWKSVASNLADKELCAVLPEGLAHKVIKLQTQLEHEISNAFKNWNAKNKALP